ncbi:restriction endonuclease PLD domain-containing protein [Neobacillus vireti]|uniref:restriction endonuclease PLD domain-containing protein n=1 Tax=Neobacillus vireti TaxID=220686 RepID=UPI003000E801
MYYHQNLEGTAFADPYIRGFRKIRILSGYASSIFLTHIMDNYPDIEIELIIGMAKRDGINKWDHNKYKEMMQNNPNITVKYHIGSPAVHTKVYHWYKDGLFSDSVTFVGSSNFSWGGFRDLKELLVEANHANINDVFDQVNPILCTDPNVEQHIVFKDVQYTRRTNNANPTFTLVDLHNTGIPVSGTEMPASEFVDLPLLIKNDTAIQEKAGLNWGQRPGREPNQAYIKVPLEVHREHPEFFPPRDHQFTVITDDGHQMVCVVAQDGRKALETSENNSILGVYFRNRLNVPLGARVDPQNVINYGRTTVRVFKIDNETYFMDFSV